MINKIGKELEKLKEIVQSDNNPPEMVFINLSSWKDISTNIIHEFIYSEQDDDVCLVKANLEKIYKIFSDETSYLNKFWEEKILAFEEAEQIDFLMLLSYIYMITPNNRETRNIEVATEAASVIFRSFYNETLVKPEKEETKGLEEILNNSGKNKEETDLNKIDEIEVINKEYGQEEKKEKLPGTDMC